MSLLAYRSDTILPSVSGDPDFGANYDVTAYEVGGQVASASSGNTVTLRAGHGFAASDKLLLLASGSIDVTTFRGVLSEASNVLTLAASATLSVAVGDICINLGPDTGTTAPNYDGSPISIYADMAGATSAISNSRVTCDAQGVFEYWYSGVEVWELIRDSSAVPLDCVTGFPTATAATKLYTSTTEPTADANYYGMFIMVRDTDEGSKLKVCHLKWDNSTYYWHTVSQADPF